MVGKKTKKDATKKKVVKVSKREVGSARPSAKEAKAIPLSLVPKWDDEAEVVIVGYGAAGASAAIAAHDAGAKVLLTEKMDIAGGNSGVSAGAMLIPENLSDAIPYYRGLSFGTADEALIRAFAEEIVGIPDLLRQLGAEFEVKRKDPPYFPALLNSRIQRIHYNPTGKEGFKFLRDLVQKRRIKVLFQTPAKALIQVPETREVVGVKVESAGKERYLKAGKGVVLACGGYEYNREMLGSFNFPGLSDFIFPWGSPGNTGDGIKMALSVGAGLWHMASLEWGAFCARVPSKEFGMAIGLGLGRSMPDGSFLFVNKYGKRFMQENLSLIHRKEPLEITHFNHDRAEYANLPAYMIFDEKYRKNGPIACTLKYFEELWGGPVGYPMVHNLYEWSEDNIPEISKGWIIKADTLGGLAAKIKVDPAGLGETVSKFKSYSATGMDPDFGRSRESLAPLETPPIMRSKLP